MERASDIVVMLNNDIEVSEAGWLEALCDATELGVLTGARIRRDAHGAVDGRALPYLDGWCLAGMREDGDPIPPPSSQVEYIDVAA